MKILKSLIPYVIIIVVVVFIRTFIVTPIRVNGNSMYPTLDGDEVMLLNKLGTIDRFDIVVVDLAGNDNDLSDRIVNILGGSAEVENNKVYVNGNLLIDENDNLIKRVIGLPGETVEIKNNNIYIDGKVLKDKYGYGITNDMEEITLDDDEYFVLGDNRTVSLDSRVFGAVKKQEIKGTTNFVMFPFKKLGKL